MDKLTVNTQIVSMRHQARKARVHIINKLIRESKKLKNKKGSEDQKKKYVRKAERFMEEVLLIKKLKDDEISKFALCNTRSVSEILSDPGELLNNKALARLSNHPSVSTCVSEFRTKFPTWNLTLPQILLDLGKKQNKKKKEKSKGNQSNKEKKPKRFKETKMLQSSDVSDDENVNPQQSAIEEENSGESSTVIQEISKRTREKVSRKKSSKTLGGETESKVAKKRLAEVKRFTEHLEEENNCSEKTESEDDVESTCAPAEATTVDPFFMCEDGKTEYLTSVKVETRDEDDSDVQRKSNVQRHSVWNMGESRQSVQMSERRNMHQRRAKNSNFKSFQQRPSVSERNSGGRRKQPPFVKKSKEGHRDQHISTAVDDGPVHPSWEAKKKLKDQQRAVFAFEGKKIKFSDD